MNNMQIDKIILWVGSKVGKKAPSYLPDENEIFEYMAENLFGKKGLQKIKDKVQEFNECIHQIDCNVEEVIYPKNVIGQWSKIQIVEVNAGLGILQEAPFNINHIYLAMLLAEGVNIITTNIDLCIEKAYSAWMKEKDCMKLSQCENGVYLYKGSNKKAGTIYHIHGTAEYIQDIGEHLDINREYFSGAFREAMLEYLKQEYEIYYLGYDGSDIYDVNVFLDLLKRQIGNISCKAKMVSTKYRREQPYTVKKMLKYFSSSEIIQQDITEFLNDFCAERTQRLPVELQEKGKELLYLQGEEAFDWKQYMKKKLYKVKRYKDILMLYVNQTLGVSVESMDPQIYEKLDEMPVKIKNLYASLMFRYRYDLVPSYGYWESQDDPVYRELQFICDNLYNCQNKKIIQLMESVEKIKEEYLSALRRKTTTLDLEKEAKILRRDINKLLPKEKPKQIPKNNYKDNADLYRLRAAIQAICLSNIKDIEKVKMDLYRAYIYNNESANRPGVLNLLDFQSFCYLTFYYKFGKKSYYDKAQKYKTILKKYKQKNSLGTEGFFYH
ncbi:MAG: SIR2 family protein [Acetivibrio sp.]